MTGPWDVLVAGGGPAGAVAAYTLAKAGRRVLLVDEEKPGGPKIGEALPGAARPLLRDLGLLSRVEDGPHQTCYGNASAWGADRLAYTDFIRDPNGPGWHLDRPAFDAALRQAAVDAGATRWPGRLLHVRRAGNEWDATLAGATVRVQWLVDATGRRALIARSQGARRHPDDALVGLYAWYEQADDAGQALTLVEARPDGWWYTARLPHHRRVVMFSTDAAHAKKVCHSPAAWNSHLAATAYVRECVPTSPGSVRVYATPAGGACLSHFGGSGWLAAGDAALSFDPVSSQGIFFALYSGMKAGQAVHAALAGGPPAVEAYAARLSGIRAAYVAGHRHIYQAEQRWPAHSFWAARQRGVR
jgi:flavin-dependent dehydrogenase